MRDLSVKDITLIRLYLNMTPFFNGAVTFGETEKSQEDNKNQQNIK